MSRPTGKVALGRVGHPEEVADVIAFLAADDASYVSGQTVYVNGGACWIAGAGVRVTSVVRVPFSESSMRLTLRAVSPCSTA